MKKKFEWKTKSTKKKNTREGVFLSTRREFGFFKPDDGGEDLFMPPDQIQGLLHQDQILIEEVERRGRTTAQVIRVLKRNIDVVYGQYIADQGILKPRNERLPSFPFNKNNLELNDGDWVQGELEDSGYVKAKKVLEMPPKPSALVSMLIHEMGIRRGFSEEAKKEAKHISEHVDMTAALEGREDLRQLPFATIDGEDAKDFDDAIWVKRHKTGFSAIVAIADVSYFVHPKSALDKEASLRGNSFYFPDRVLPMLPEVLSNGLCSLCPNEDRLVMAVEMTFDKTGKRTNIKPMQAIIHSHARLTYQEVDQFLRQKEHNIEHDQVRDMLLDAQSLLRQLHGQRRKRGGFDLDIKKHRVILEKDEIKGMACEDRLLAHQLIEELMLAANTAILEVLHKSGKETLYRAHPQPQAKDISNLNDFLKPFGIHIGDSDNESVQAQDIAQLLAQLKNMPISVVAQKLILRAMQKAIYTTDHDGHFALAYDVYGHFTSPIRRYADLIIHRQLRAYLVKKNPLIKDLEKTAVHINEQEQKQNRLEWDAFAVLSARYHLKDIGKEFNIRITGMNDRHVFALLISSGAEMRLDMSRHFAGCKIDKQRQCLVDNQGQYRLGLGDESQANIASIDVMRGYIEGTPV
ncbi:MAG: VacB/RNase II family 3'-5' exoribonuclease [Mariprofundaceae bacterium]|nr:VacB/RNase II family 3'-5' exoribonuclease [Mariprofundaceae bacterium]